MCWYCMEVELCKFSDLLFSKNLAILHILVFVTLHCGRALLTLCSLCKIINRKLQKYTISIFVIKLCSPHRLVYEKVHLYFSQRKVYEERMIEEETARRVEEMVAKRVEEEVEKRKAEIEKEVTSDFLTNFFSNIPNFRKSFNFCFLLNLNTKYHVASDKKPKLANILFEHFEWRLYECRN